MRNNGIKYLRSAPYHPASNGLAELFIQSFKQSMKVMVKDGLRLNQHISKFPTDLRSTPHTMTGILFLKHQIHTRFDLL